MLVLSRRVGEEVYVPSCQLTVRLLDIVGGRVRLGFSAPAGVAILRQEIVSKDCPDGDTERGGRFTAVRVLLAEPDEWVANTYADCLRQRGAIVTTASTGLECLERLQDFVPDVLVLDPELLWGGGEGVLSVMHEQPALRPAFVVLLSYARDRSLLHRVSRFKVDDYRIKPLNAAQLANCLSRMLRSQQIPSTQEAVTAY